MSHKLRFCKLTSHKIQCYFCWTCTKSYLTRDPSQHQDSQVYSTDDAKQLPFFFLPTSPLYLFLFSKTVQRQLTFMNYTVLKLFLKSLTYYCADLEKSRSLGFSNIESRSRTDDHEHLEVSQVWLSEGRCVFTFIPLMQLKLHHQVIKLFSEYTVLNAAVKLVTSDILIKGASCWISLLLKMLL